MNAVMEEGYKKETEVGRRELERKFLSGMAEWIDTQEKRLKRKLILGDYEILSTEVVADEEVEITYKEPFYQKRRIRLHKTSDRWLIYKLEQAVRTEEP